MQAGDIKHGEQVDDEFIPVDARPVCTKCLRPCHPLQFYCDSCDSNEVINPLASYMPYVRIRFECGIYGKMWRVVLYGKKASLILRSLCLFMTIAFAPTLVIVGFPLFLIGKIKDLDLQRTVKMLFYILLLTILIALLIMNILSI